MNTSITVSVGVNMRIVEQINQMPVDIAPMIPDFSKYLFELLFELLTFIFISFISLQSQLFKE